MKKKYIPIKFQFNYYTLQIDCFFKNEFFYNLDKKLSEYWHKNAHQYHREDGPAIIRYHENGKKMYEQWYLNGIFIKEERYEYSK